MERVLLPELGLTGELVPQEEIIQEDEAVKAAMVETVLDLWERGLISRTQAHEQLERLLTIKFEEFNEEEGDFPEPAPEETTEEAEA